jgi:hypothetical protein
MSILSNDEACILNGDESGGRLVNDRRLMNERGASNTAGGA